MHIRRQIRDAVAAALIGETLAGDRVQSGRVYAEHSLPAISIYTPEEVVQRDLTGIDHSTIQFREVTISVEIRDRAVDGVDDALDALALAVEQTLTAQLYGVTPGALAALVRYLDLDRTTVALESGAEAPIGLAVMSWVAGYVTDGADPSAAVA